MAFFVYILRCRDGSLYTGIARDLEKRMKQHSLGRGSRYVRSRLPFRLVYSEEFGSLPGAMRRENEIKRLARAEKAGLVGRGPPHPSDYEVEQPPDQDGH
jgi:putative endonuclease